MNNNYHVFKEDELTIMYDVKSGHFVEICCDESEYDSLYNEFFANSQEKRDSYAFEGDRLGRLSFVTTERCNLKCKYCFAESGTYNSVTHQIMSAETMRNAFIYVCEKYKKGVNLVHFFGGEPMIGIKSIIEFIKWCKFFCEDNEIVLPNYSIVTNGTIMSDDIYRFLDEYHVNIVVSIDGNKKMNDYARISDDFTSVHDVICKNMHSINNKKRNFKIGCETTLNKIHISSYEKGNVKEWLDELCALGFNYATIGVAETPVEDCKILDEDKAVLQGIEREVIDYFFDRYKNNNDFISVEIMSLIRQMAQKKKSLTCGAGYNSITVMPDGKVLPCYQFYHDDRFVMGNVNECEDENFVNVREVFKKNYMDDTEECQKCWLKNQCTIHCKGFSYNSKGKLNSIAKTRCWLVEEAMHRLMYNIIKLKKDKEKYKNFVDNLFAFNKEYSYNK